MEPTLKKSWILDWNREPSFNYAMERKDIQIKSVQVMK